MKYKRLLLVLVGVVALGSLWQFFPLGDARVRLASIPESGLSFTSRAVPFSAEERERFGKATALRRLYQVGRDQFFLTVIDGTHNRHAVHDPTYCFRGSGWEIAGRETVPLPGGVGQLLHLVKGNEKTEAIYWFSDGVQRYASPTRYWGQATLRRLTLGRSGDEPVLVIVQPASDRPVPWSDLIDRVGGLLDI